MTRRGMGLFDDRGDPAADPAGDSAFDPDHPSSPMPDFDQPKPSIEDAAPAEDYSEYEEDDKNRTIYMTALFLVLMVLYVGFCFYYRKVKTRRSVGDYDDGTGEDGETGRDRQRRENQSVLDESASATSRARQNAEEQAKLEERKKNIRDALLLRLIVDEEEQGGEGGEHKGNCECEQCRYWKWESAREGDEKTTKLEEGGEKKVVAVSALDVASAAKKGGIITIQEESDEDDEDFAEFMVDLKLASNEGGEAADTKNDAQDVEAQADDGSESKAVKKDDESSSPPPSPTLAPLSPPQSPKPSGYTQRPPGSPSRLLSSPRKYTDALNCGSRTKTYTDALNCGSAARSAMACSNQNVTSCGSSMNMSNCSIHGKSCASMHGKLCCKSSSNLGSGDAQTVSLSAVVSMYGEECNICLSQFQVGDRAAWSKHHDRRSSEVSAGDNAMEQDDGADNCVMSSGSNDNGTPNGNDEATSEEAGYGCRHVFHEECISRWLLVRDGCPICRRSYFPKNSTSESADETEATVASDSTAAASSSPASVSSSSNDVDVERGESNQVTPTPAAAAAAPRARVDLTGSWW